MKSFRSFTETPVDEACWKGYEKKGMKTMFGKRYPNCVKKEGAVDEKKFIPTVTIEKRNKKVAVKKFKTEKEAEKFIRQYNKKNQLRRGKGLWYNPRTGVELTRNF